MTDDELEKINKIRKDINWLTCRIKESEKKLDTSFTSVIEKLNDIGIDILPTLKTKLHDLEYDFKRM